jgi:tetratricopeptide (TPR) repeat protein
MLAREQDNFRAALDFTLGCGSAAGPRLARALGRFWLARGLFSEARGWLERALTAATAADPRLRADLHRLLGAVLYAAGDLDRAQAVLDQGSQIAAAAGLPAVQARSRPCERKSGPPRKTATTPKPPRRARRPRRCWNPRAIWRAWPRRWLRLASCGSGSLTPPEHPRPWNAPPPARSEAATTGRSRRPEPG